MKPTVAIINAVINHVVSNSGQISQDISNRDNHPPTIASNVSCRFVQQFSNYSRLVFDVDFTYHAPPNREGTDDITVRIEVRQEGGILQFGIVDAERH